MDQKPRIAVIGIGKWGKKLIEAFTRQGVNISYCLHNGSKENSIWLSETYPLIKLAPNLEIILSNNSVDAIIIATPIKTHFELAKKALMSNKHVFLEKPGTETVDEMLQLDAEAKARKIILAIGFVFVHHPVCQYLKSFLSKEKILGIHFEWNKWGTFNEDLIPNLFTHEVSIISALGLRIDSKTINYKNHKIITSGDILHFSAQTENKIPITININRVSLQKRKSVTIITDKNKYIWQDNELKIIKADQTTESIPLSTQPSLDIEVADFIDSIKNKRKPLVDASFVINILKISSAL